MLPELQAWEQQRTHGAPDLFVISTGQAQDNRSLALHSPIVLENGFSTGWAFGATGTPSAVLVDRQGRIASSVAVGAQAVLELAGTPS